MNDTTDHNQHPILLRVALRLGRPFGVVFVPEMHVQVIRRMGQYAGVKGPGLIHYDPMTESLGPLVSIVGRRREYPFAGLISRDGVPFSAQVNILYGYDPRVAPELAPVLTRMPPEAIAGLAHMFLEWALRAAVNKHDASQLPQHEVRAQIEAEVRDTLMSEMGFLGIQPRSDHPIRVLRIEPPSSLIDRNEQIAQRRANVLAGTEFHPADFRRALVTEFIEHLARTGAGESIINFNDLLESYVAERKLGRILENPPQSTFDQNTDSPVSRPDTNAPKPPPPPEKPAVIQLGHSRDR